MSKIILVTGGARSGKSSFALECCEAISEKRLFIATCPKIDPEMSDRVRRHQEERKGRGWVTKETTVDLESVFSHECDGYGVILLDCLTLWVNNVLFESENSAELISDHVIRDNTLGWLSKAKELDATLVCVTNEVGLGIVPENALARKYRDLVGTVNQTIGRMADEVVLVSCGVPLYLKK